MEKDKKKIILTTMLILIITVINIYLYMYKVIIPNKNNEEVVKQYEANQAQNTINENESTDNLVNVTTKSEVERIEYYLAQYIEKIQNQNYQQAYELLYPDFKNNYFKTVEDFENYAKQNYPQFITVTYADVERQGNYFILSVIINDVLNGENTKEQKFIVYENDFNNFTLSFQVK